MKATSRGYHVGLWPGPSPHTREAREAASELGSFRHACTSEQTSRPLQSLYPNLADSIRGGPTFSRQTRGAGVPSPEARQESTGWPRRPTATLTAAGLVPGGMFRPMGELAGGYLPMVWFRPKLEQWLTIRIHLTYGKSTKHGWTLMHRFRGYILSCVARLLYNLGVWVCNLHGKKMASYTIHMRHIWKLCHDDGLSILLVIFRAKINYTWNLLTWSLPSPCPIRKPPQMVMSRGGHSIVLLNTTCETNLLPLYYVAYIILNFVIFFPHIHNHW